ncbi:MAG TPA: hypothetical protein VNA25_12655 [Phycisphaerae bacterium]|nr:hypothetical protein [Phycisphaerae bacterium]
MPTEVKDVEEIYDVIEEAQKKATPASETTTVEFKTFAVHTPTGFVCHYTLTGGAKVLSDSLKSLEWFVRNDFEPHLGWGVPQGVGRSEDPNAEKCGECGATMQYKEGTGRTGKPYKMWRCPVDKNHPPVWVNA